MSVFGTEKPLQEPKKLPAAQREAGRGIGYIFRYVFRGKRYRADHSPSSFSIEQIFTQTHRILTAASSSSGGGSVGAMRMFLSSGSFL